MTSEHIPRWKNHCFSHFFCKNVANKFLKERFLKNEKSYIFADQKFR